MAVGRRRIELMLCTGTGCVAGGAFHLKEILERELSRHNLGGDVGVVVTGCNGFCGQGPVLRVRPEGIFYGWLAEEDIPLLVREHFLKGRPVRQKMFVPPEKKEPIPLLSQIPFFRKQALVVLKNRGLIDPEKIEEYVARDGYRAVEKALLRMTPEEIIGVVKRSGLRGRGGAGFPTGRKWEEGRRHPGSPKYIICNGDEGDPGAFMDRSTCESDPHAVLEGMIIGGKAVGASRGYIYIRTEYPLAIDRLAIAIDQARRYGFLGRDILGSGFDFDIEIRQGSGAFVCGEATALVRSIQGLVPEPRQRPPRLVEDGIWGKPTVLNNVETWANVPQIIGRGAEWFASLGTETSKGTKIFSLAGKITNTGLIEVPMGISLREIVYEIGGGIPMGKAFKAVQTGGPSGGCIPAGLMDLPVDYESLTKAGSMMGSGGMVVMDEDTCMVDVAKFYLDFTADESCGRCTTCREGSAAMLEVLTRITRGEGRPGDIEFLEELSLAVTDASLCGLGQSLANPVLSTIRYFRDEYEAHIAEKNCPGRVCKDLIMYYIDPDRCPGCTLCLKECPAGAITGRTKHIHVIDQSACTKCGECLEICPPKVGAVVKLSGRQIRELEPLPAPIPAAEWKKRRAEAGAKDRAHRPGG